MEIKEVRLTDVCDFKGGTQPPKEEWKNNPEIGYVRMLQIRDFTQNKEEHVGYVKDNHKLNKCSADDILIGRYGASIGKILTGKEGAYNVAIIKTILDERFLLKKYLYYVLSGTEFQNFISSIGGRAAQAGFNKEDLTNFKLILPSIEDQIRIATLLSKAEALIKQRKESIDLLDEYLKSTFLEMFGDPVKNEKKYNFTELENLCSVIVDCPHSTPEKSNSKTEYPCIRTSELKNGYISWASMQYLEKNEYTKRTQRLVPIEGDIVYGREGTFGDAIRIPSSNKFSLGQRTMLFRPDYKKCTSNFLWAMAISDFVYKQAKNNNSGSTVGHVNVKDIRKFKVLFPPLDIQIQFSNIVDKIDILKAQYKSSLAELENLYDSLSQKAFNGELNLEKGAEMLMAAEPKEIYKLPVQSTIPDNKRGFAKQVLGGKIVKMFKDDKQFTHIKFQKLQYLAEHIIEEDLDWNYYRQMAGPYDNKFMHTVFNRLEKNSWFRKCGDKYYPLEKVNDIDKYYQNYFADKSEKLNNLFGLLQKGTEKFCEAVATIYAVWNNHIILKQDFNKERVKADFFDWSNRKTIVFTEEEFEKALVWMQNHEIVPTGFGALIKEKK